MLSLRTPKLNLDKKYIFLLLNSIGKIYQSIVVNSKSFLDLHSNHKQKKKDKLRI